MYFTSWDANTYLCLLSVFPEEVVRGMIKLVKKTHEAFVREETLDYYCNLDIYKLYQNDKYYPSNPIKEFKYMWRWRCPEKRRDNIVQWTRHEHYWNCSHICKIEPLNPGNGTSRGGYWNSGDAWSYSIEDRNLDISEWSEEEEEYFDIRREERRKYVSEWYKNIHEGRYFLFFKENDISSNQSIDYGALTSSSICTASRDGCREQILQDLLTIDGPGLGEPSGNHIEHINDLFI
jgi:hypothetical protein